MKNIIHLKYKDEGGLIHFIKPWANFVTYTDPGSEIHKLPSSERIKEWGGKFKTEQNSKKNYLDYYLEFKSEEQLTLWLLRWA